MKLHFHLGLDGVDAVLVHRQGWGFRFAWSVYAEDLASRYYWMGVKLAVHFPWEHRYQGEMMRHRFEIITDEISLESVLNSL